MNEIKQMGRPALSEREKDIYDRKRKSIVQNMPKHYMPIIDHFCKMEELEKIPNQQVYNFVYGITYNSELLKKLQLFIEWQKLYKK